MNICNLLFNNTKNDVQLSNTIIGLLLEINQIINSNDDKNLMFDNLSQRVDNYKKLFTNMKDNKITNLSNLPKNLRKNLQSEKCVFTKK